MLTLPWFIHSHVYVLSLSKWTYLTVLQGPGTKVTFSHRNSLGIEEKFVGESQGTYASKVPVRPGSSYDYIVLASTELLICIHIHISRALSVLLYVYHHIQTDVRSF